MLFDFFTITYYLLPITCLLFPIPRSLFPNRFSFDNFYSGLKTLKSLLSESKLLLMVCNSTQRR